MNYKSELLVIPTTKEAEFVASLSMVSQSYLLLNIRVIKVALFLVFFMSAGFIGSAQQTKRIISLAPSISENIYLIGAQDKLVGCTSYCIRAVEDGVSQVGSTVEVNVEKVVSLQPDLVLAMELTKPQDIATIRKLGIRVEIIHSPKNFEEICEQTLKLGKLVGNTTEAEKVVQSAKSDVEKIRKDAKRFNESKIFFQIGANPIFTVLENTFMNDFISICNGQNIAAGMTKGTITRESVLLKNPDVILIAEMGGFGAEEQKVWNTYSGMSAVKENKVFLISSETSCSPTPSNFVSALQDVYKFVSE